MVNPVVNLVWAVPNEVLEKHENTDLSQLNITDIIPEENINSLKYLIQDNPELHFRLIHEVFPLLYRGDKRFTEISDISDEKWNGELVRHINNLF